MKLMWREKLGLTECPYVHRWGFEIKKLGSIRVHHWFGPDDLRYLHDHPWWFLTFVFKGGYTDISEKGADCVRAPGVRFRPALHRHSVYPDPDGAWTLLVTGPSIRKWGFWTRNSLGKPKFLTARRYFEKIGHHPCHEEGDYVNASPLDATSD